MLPLQLHLPDPLLTPLATLRCVREEAWLWRRVTDSDNRVSQVVDKVLKFFNDDDALMRAFGMAVLIPTRILQCVEQQNQLHCACKNWVSAIKGKTLIKDKSEWKRHCGWGWVSVSTVIWLHNQGKTLILRIQQVAICTLQVGKHVLILSLRVMDMIEALSFSSTAEEEGVKELCVNVKQLKQNFVANKGLLIRALKENKALVARIVKILHSSRSADQIIENAESLFNNVAKLFEGDHETVQDPRYFPDFTPPQSPSNPTIIDQLGQWWKTMTSQAQN